MYLTFCRKFQYAVGQANRLAEADRLQATPSSGERAMAVECQLGKLPAPEGHPGSRLVPGVTEGHCARKARNEGVSAGSTAE